MAVIEADATLNADSSVTAGAAAVYAAASTMNGDSSFSGAAGVVYDAASTMDGESSIYADVDIYDEDSITMVADSSMAAAATVDYEASTLMAGDSSVTAPIDLLLGAELTTAGNSIFIFDPAGITVTNTLSGPQIPATARPITVPTIRIVPAAPPPPSFSVGPVTGREEER